MLPNFSRIMSRDAEEKIRTFTRLRIFILGRAQLL